MKKTWFAMPYTCKKIVFNGKTDIRYPEAFVHKFLLAFTKKGDKVFDPFSGFGTMLLVAQRLKRVGIGIEYDKKRCNFIRKQLRLPNKIIHGSALEISKYNLPKFDFCITSPPYMRSFDRENPFSNYSKRGNYTQYLKDTRKIFSQIKKVMKRNATVVVEVSNTFGKGHPMTPLAWDIGKVISKVLFLEKEIIYCVKNGTASVKGPNHSYCLIYKNK